MTEVNRRKARLQFILIATVFVGPLVAAALLYYQGDAVQPAGRTNHGALLEPVVNLGDELPGSAVIALHDQSWLLLYSNGENCSAQCLDALYKLRQLRLMLGKEMGRLTRVFLRGDTAPDTVFLVEEHPGLITIEDRSLQGLLQNKRPANLPAGGYFLIDPLGNLVMYFRPNMDPADVVDDLKRLLNLSRIG